jgi:hypothetical protein
MRCCPRFITDTTPTLRNTPRCFDTAGCDIRNRSTTSPTAYSLPSASTPINSRRRGSAIALKTSVVVAALAILSIYADIGMCQAALILALNFLDLTRKSCLPSGLENRRAKAGARRFSNAEPGKDKHRYVVILAERDRSLGGFCRVWFSCKQSPDSIKTIELAAGTACFEQTIGVKGKMITRIEMDRRLLIGCSHDQAKRQRAGQADLAIVEERRGMACRGQRTRAVRVEPQGKAGGKAAVQAAVQPPVERLEQFGRTRRGLCSRSDGTDDETNRHRRF